VTNLSYEHTESPATGKCTSPEEFSFESPVQRRQKNKIVLFICARWSF